MHKIFPHSNGRNQPGQPKRELITMCFLFSIALIFSGDLTARAAIVYSPRALPKAYYRIIQTNTVSGKVTDGKGASMPGVIIKVKNTSGGTQTDLNGNYTIKVPDANATLVFSYVGYITQEKAVGNATNLNITLVEDTKSLSAVVVVGYGTQKRVNVTAAIGSAPMKELKDQPIFNVATGLAGKVPGLSVKQTSGSPGSNPVMQVRGIGSISAGNAPLIVVDDNIVSADVYQTLSANDIESIDILKDGSSAAIYGSRGSNGVILITTKRGKVGTPKVDVDYFGGVQQVSKKLDLLNAQQSAELTKDAANNAYLDAVPTGNISDPNSMRTNPRMRYPRGELAGYNFDDPVALAALPTIDYQDLIFRNATTNNLALTVSGGSDKARYVISGGYQNQNGVVIESGIKRYNLRANVDVQVSSKLKAGVGINPTYRVEQIVNSDGHWSSGGVINAALTTLPYWPVRDPNGNYWINAPLATFYNWATISNAVANATERHRKGIYTNLLANAYAEYAFLDNLKYRVSSNANMRMARNDAFITSKLPPNNPASGSASSDQNGTWLVNQTVTYAKAFKSGHNFDVLAGMEATKSQFRVANLAGNNFPNDVVETLNAAAIPTLASTEITENSMVSYFSRLSYNYLSRYLVNLSIRTDGSSMFGPVNRWGTFPAGSIGWNISEEEFAKKWNWLSSAKVRVSYALSGNNAFSSSYPFATLMATANAAFNNTLVNGVYPSTLGNEKLTWEKNQQLDVGLDFGVFKNRIALTIDFYNRITKDLLLAVDVPTLTGYGSSFQNIGSMRNRGLELGLSTNNLTGAFTWSTNTNLTFNRNVVLALGSTGAPIYGNSGISQTNITVIGQPIGNIFGYKQIGVFKDKAEVDAYPHFPTTRPGDVKYEDVNGDGIMDANDRTILGNNQPKFMYGMTNNFTFKGFDLSVAFNGTYGGQVLNLSRRFFDNLEGISNNLAVVLDRWRSPEQPGNGIVPRANSNTTGNNGSVSSRWMESGSFLRLQNVTLGYKLPNRWMSAMKVTNARLYISGQNIHTWSKYLNYNPDVSNYSSALAPGVDYGSYPLYRTFVLGLNMSF